MFTSPRVGASQPYVVSKPKKTNSGMLLQSQNLKISSVDKTQDRHETGGDCHMDSQLADNLDEKREALKTSVTTDVAYRFCTKIQNSDGYSYNS
jgi:hypothetical protein